MAVLRNIMGNPFDGAAPVDEQLQQHHSQHAGEAALEIDDLDTFVSQRVISLNAKNNEQTANSKNECVPNDVCSWHEKSTPVEKSMINVGQEHPQEQDSEYEGETFEQDVDD
uniref:Uncharacterized protein n=1 Tax=Anopheles atroparvus TaxID=41427 RepID=A0A182J494_ANOAO